MGAARLRLAALIASAGLVAALLMVAAPASAHGGWQHCRKVPTKFGPARAAARRVPCREARKVARGFYHRIATHAFPDGHHGSLYWNVRGFRCYSGLAGSEAFCKHHRQHVFATTRPDDRLPG